MNLSHFSLNTILKVLLISTLTILIQSSSYTYNSSKKNKTKSDIINWDPDQKLKQSDFRSKRKKVSGFAVATTASSFGYSITDNNGHITGSIYVEFHCNDSWWNPDYKNSENRAEILAHEQLHFDICELYGRKLFKEVLKLRRHGDLDFDSMESLSTKLEEEYTRYQDKYDHETNHSINLEEQVKWNNRIRKQLDDIKDYANYSSF